MSVVNASKLFPCTYILQFVVNVNLCNAIYINHQETASTLIIKVKLSQWPSTVPRILTESWRWRWAHLTFQHYLADDNERLHFVCSNRSVRRIGGSVGIRVDPDMATLLLIEHRLPACIHPHCTLSIELIYKLTNMSVYVCLFWNLIYPICCVFKKGGGAYLVIRL
jgi:hypothetical protein